MWWGCVWAGALVLLLALMLKAKNNSCSDDKPLQIVVVQPPLSPRVHRPRNAHCTHKRHGTCSFKHNIPKQLLPAQHISPRFRERDLSATRSPSLEDDSVKMSSNDEPKIEEMSPGTLRRYKSISTRLNTVDLEQGSSKLTTGNTRMEYSPRLDSLSSPKYFTPLESVSPAFLFDPSPKSVYYDTVRSPKFFPETPKTDTEIPQSPRALSDNLNRNNGNTDKPNSKPNSPRVLSARSPKVHSRNKENYFTFDNVVISEDGATRLSPRPRRYYGRNSIEKERFTPPADKEIRRYKRHNSCDTNYSKVEIIETKELEKSEQDEVDCCAQLETLNIDASHNLQVRRERLKSISLDSDSARIIEQNLGLPVALQSKENEYLFQEVSASYESMERNQDLTKSEVKSPDLKKGLRQCDTHSIIEMPRFSPKEFEIIVTAEDGATAVQDSPKKKINKNLRNLTIDLNKRDTDLEKELLEFEKLYTDGGDKKVKTPTLKVKATSLDSSEPVNLSLPQKKSSDVPQNSVSVPNTPKRQVKRILPQKHTGKTVFSGDQRRLYMRGQDSGIFLKENHANLMLYQPFRAGRMMGSFDENIADPDTVDESNQNLGSNLNFKQNLSVSSTNLKTLPEGVPSDDFAPSVQEKINKKLHRRNSNQSLMIGESKISNLHSLQNSNCSLNSAGIVRTSYSNFNLSEKTKYTCDRRESSSSEQLTRSIAFSSTNITENQSKNCLLQRRGSNNSLTLNLAPANLSRHSSNTSLNREAKITQKKGLLERRSSNTSLTLNINNSNPQLSTRGLSISNYNLESSCLSQYNSSQSIDQSETKKGILERRSSNTSLTLNIPQEPRDLEIDDSVIKANLKELPHKHRKSLSTENLMPKSLKLRRDSDKFGSHDNLWSEYRSEQINCPQNLTYVCGDPENEIIYAFGQESHYSNTGFTKNITTKPLSPQTTSEDFRLYLANMHHLQNASSVLSRQKLKDMNEVFQNGYSEYKCSTKEGSLCCSGNTEQACCEYQKVLLRNMHQEFWDMPTNFQEKPIVSGSNSKNRYKTILPNEHSRFILSTEETTSDTYINANFIKGHEYTKNSYIATQGPLQNTIYDFWHMIRQNYTNHKQNNPKIDIYVQKIVMLTNFVENNRQKCDKYFPLDYKEVLIFENPDFPDNSLSVENCGVISKSGYSIRHLKLTYKDIIVPVYHYWFHNWADHKCPKDVNSLLTLSLDILNNTKLNFNTELTEIIETCKCSGSPKVDTKFVFPPLENVKTSCELKMPAGNTDWDFEVDVFPPIVVHCSAGIGRTGCLIAILNGIKQLYIENRVDVLGIVCNMRLNRGGMVQNSEQYELIHKVLCLFEKACLPAL